MQRGGFAWVVVGIVAAILILIFSITIPIILVFGLPHVGPESKATGSGSNGGGCTLPDNYFTDTSIAANPDQVVKQLSDFLQSKRSNGAADIATLTPKIKQVLSTGQQQGLNPAIVLAMWFGETSYKPDLVDKAFGYGNTDTKILPGTQGWDNQVKGVYSRLALARDGGSLYSEPAGADMFTRLWYNYTTQLQNAYKAAGNQWVDSSDGSVSSRFSILRLLVPSQITCSASTLLASSGSCPDVTTKMLTKSSVQGRATGTPKVIILHYTGDEHSLDTEWGYFNNNDRDVDVQYEVFHSGQVAQYEPDNLSAHGAAGYNQPTKDYGSGAVSISIENQGSFESSDPSQQETSAQTTANINLVGCLMKKYNITKNNVTIASTNSRAQEPYNVISHKEADARSGSDNGVRGSRRSDPGTRFLNKVVSALR